jgi:hypothetical protein
MGHKISRSTMRALYLYTFSESHKTQITLFFVWQNINRACNFWLKLLYITIENPDTESLMSEKSDPILNKLDFLAKKMDTLAMIIACKPNGDQISRLLKNKSQKEQIRTLKEWNFPNKITALIIGTTPETVRVTLAKTKSKKKKRK